METIPEDEGEYTIVLPNDKESSALLTIYGKVMSLGRRCGVLRAAKAWGVYIRGSYPSFYYSADIFLIWLLFDVYYWTLNGFYINFMVMVGGVVFSLRVCLL